MKCSEVWGMWVWGCGSGCGEVGVKCSEVWGSGSEVGVRGGEGRGGRSEVS